MFFHGFNLDVYVRNCLYIRFFFFFCLGKIKLRIWCNFLIFIN